MDGTAGMTWNTAVDSAAGGLACWIETARRGDAEALGKALESFRAYLLLVANEELDPDLRTKLGGSDLVQETFLHAQHDLGSFRGKTDLEWRLWLRGILIHRLANHRRHYRATVKRRLEREVALAETPEREWPAESPSPSTSMATRELEEAILEAVARLPEHHREVVLWHHREHLPFDEIGRRLGVSTEAARKHWERALKGLRRELRGSHVLP
ncbi:sigma-70 family RNA polymerase sigma factor [Paludisphaera borealis]|uniref:ECF RNA polymerase sigma factor SigW n=1 Tax=Paludisphaera borealis TaxID=1387353 RepID=A0A1U7CXS9_9BACT|nr:sigma-70 family RNA polymerase sigma factor [Paludisphaera borealis]APW63721.1 ECF RNA polymerase sigma factor SigW [Paludisphaera borealis]